MADRSHRATGGRPQACRSCHAGSSTHAGSWTRLHQRYCSMANYSSPAVTVHAALHGSIHNGKRYCRHCLKRPSNTLVLLFVFLADHIGKSSKNVKSHLGHKALISILRFHSPQQDTSSITHLGLQIALFEFAFVYER